MYIRTVYPREHKLLPTTYVIVDRDLSETEQYLRDHPQTTDPITLIHVLSNDYIVDGNGRSVVAYQQNMALRARYLSFGESAHIIDQTGEAYEVTYNLYLLRNIFLRRLEMRRRGLYTLEDVVRQKDAGEYI